MSVSESRSVTDTGLSETDVVSMSISTSSSTDGSETMSNTPCGLQRSVLWNITHADGSIEWLNTGSVALTITSAISDSCIELSAVLLEGAGWTLLTDATRVLIRASNNVLGSVANVSFGFVSVDERSARINLCAKNLFSLFLNSAKAVFLLSLAVECKPVRRSELTAPLTIQILTDRSTTVETLFNNVELSTRRVHHLSFVRVGAMFLPPCNESVAVLQTVRTQFGLSTLAPATVHIKQERSSEMHCLC